MVNGVKWYMSMNLVGILIILINVLVGVAFLTLLERKILGYVQLRKGPNKVGLGGLLQPFSDAIKLFTKELFILNKSNWGIYYWCPIMIFFFMLVIWLLMPFISHLYYMNYSLLLLFIILSLMSYIYMLIGWSSNSLYSMMGAMRVVAQTLSYEVSLIMIILIMMILVESYSIAEFGYWQKNGHWFLFSVMPVFAMFFLSILAEMNRSPMDFIEGESELVSGFNVEYFSGGFALIFMAEYGMIIFFSYLGLMIFTGVGHSIFMILFLNVMMMLIIFMRGLLPRMRYDELMYLCWKVILPLIMSYKVWILSVKFFFMIL